MVVLVPLIVLTIVLGTTIVLRPRITRHMGGRAIAFLAMFLLPVLALAGAANNHMERSKTTTFCISCHEMQPYFDSLHIDEGRHLPAVHYQNRTIPRDKACFTCHTQYTMFGDIKAKLNGLKHLWVHYMGTIPDKIELYEPYNDRECLHCHAGSRVFEELPEHVKVRDKLKDGALRCFSCHFQAHDIEGQHRLPHWTPETR
jgi:cytochrome c-type protein NapC